MASTNPFTVPAYSTETSNDQISQHLQGLQFPLTLTFKVLALARQLTVTDAQGRTVLYTKQKMLKLKEHVEIWTDTAMGNRLADIKANKIVDWSARYNFTDAQGTPLGSVGRRGWRSIWKAHYESFNEGSQTPDFSIQETNPWAKIFDSILEGLPIIGMFSGYFFHPSYLASRQDGTPLMRLTKQPAFWQGKFKIEKLADLHPHEELNLILSFLMLVLLERSRG
jgi:hypothetical protein